MSDGVKHIYFIRHGETLKNRTRVHQGPDEPLTPKGKVQALKVASVLRERDIDTLLSSDYVRARETATIISTELDMPFSIENSVEEFRRPNELYGKHHFSWNSFVYLFKLYRHKRDPDWDNDGAENMLQVRNRTLTTRDVLYDSSGTNIAVVSHSIYMDMFREVICNEKPLSLWKFAHGLILHKRVPNTGIYHFTYDPNAMPNTCVWQFVEMILPDPNAEY